MYKDIRFRLRIPREIRHGHAVPIALAVENTGKKTIDLHLRGRTIAFDVIVQAADGSTVWQRLSGEIIPAILQLKALAAGDTLVLTARWDQRTQTGAPVPPGDYKIRGVLLTDGESMRTAPETLSIRLETSGERPRQP